MDDCIFCRIVKGEIPCHKVYEDRQFLGFLDIRPCNPGHTLVVPKKHYRWVWDVAEEYGKIANTIALGLKKAFSTDYVVSFVMGDEVPHAHIHFVPRFPGDGHGALIDLKNIKEIPALEMKEIAEQVRRAI